MEVTDVLIKELNNAKYNPRKITDEELDGLRYSLKTFGFVDPVIVNKRNMTIVGGHMRTRAAESLGYEAVPVHFVDLSDAEEKALNVALNSQAISGKYDDAILKPLLEEIKLMMPEHYEQLRFDVIEPPELHIDQLPSGGDDPGLGELPKQPKSRKGDVWILGDSRLMCGDSTMVDDVATLMNKQIANMVFTDPPYGVSYQSNARTKTEKFAVIENDDKIITEWIPHIEIFSRGFVFIWTTWRILTEWLEATSVIGEPTNLIVWDKGGGGLGDLKKTFSTDHELAIVFHRNTEITGKRIGSVWSIGKDAATKYIHPTQKPAELAMMAIENCTNNGDIVLDFFNGSGSTLIACEKLGRKYYGMELDAAYVDATIKRWQGLTDKQAMLESTGETYDEVSRY